MFNILTSAPSASVRRGIVSIACAALVLLGQPGFSQAFDARSEAREEIRLFRADISDASQKISALEGRIFAGDLLIATNEVALSEAKKTPNNDAAIIALQITLAALKAKKDDLVKEKQEWEQFKRNSEKGLADWEAYLRKLGG